MKDNWKFIPANDRKPLDELVNIETGNSKEPQLYNLSEDLGEKNNLPDKFPEKVKELSVLLNEEIK